jgi:hypothetical protein
MRAMPSFSIKALMYLTALVAAYVLMASEERNAPSLPGFVGFGVFVGLILYKALYDVIKMRDQPESAKRPE